MIDAVRLAVGTLTAIPVTPPRRVDRSVAGQAMLLGPLAVFPLGAIVAASAWAGIEGGLAALPVAALCVGVLALGSRTMHLDGLADTADGLASSYDRERSLEVMRSGSTGPAGAAALVIVLLVQVSSLAVVISRPWGWLVAGVLICMSRGALSIACLRGVPAAREQGLGASCATSVSVGAMAAQWVVIAGVTSAALTLSSVAWWHGLAAAVAAVVVVAAAVARSIRRLGGVTGDTFGAVIELALAALLLVATA